MKIRNAFALSTLAVLALGTGCASTGDMDSIRSELAETRALAVRAASEAERAAAKAELAAQSADAAAASAAQAAEQAEASSARSEQVFRQSLRK